MRLDCSLFMIIIPALELSDHYIRILPLVAKQHPPCGWLQGERMWETASLTFVPDVGEHGPDSFLHLGSLTPTLRCSLLLQPQGHEQVDPPPRHLPSVLRGFPAGASRALKGHLLQQRGQVPPAPPRVSLRCRPSGLLLSGNWLICRWLRTPRRSLRQRPRSALGAAFGPPAKPKFIQEIK